MNGAVRLERLIIQISLWSGSLLGTWLLSLLLLQALFGRQLERMQTQQLGRELALNVRLTELTLERYPPAIISELTGLELKVSERPPGPAQTPVTRDWRMKELQSVLCNSLTHCPRLLPAPASEETREVWIELISPLEPVWMRSALPTARGWPPEPMLMVVGLVGAIVLTGVLYLLLEVEQPLRGLETALARVGESSDPAIVPQRGAPEVQQITQRFNAMVQRLAANRRERATMLAGIAHDLRAPITRLRFRLSLPALNEEEKRCCNSDLESLERITGQFLLYAGGGEREAMITCPLDQWLAEVAAGYSASDVLIDLTPIQGAVRPVALGRAVGNLIENGFCYGIKPVVLRLRDEGNDVVIEIWDQGEGIPKPSWDRALQPFQRLDDSRGAQGHCGLGLAIVNHVVSQHGGSIGFRTADNTPGDAPGRFAVLLRLPLQQTGGKDEKS